jgi:hypothetical protein
MDYKLELVLIPVSDLDRVRKFYLEQEVDRRKS